MQDSNTTIKDILLTPIAIAGTILGIPLILLFLSIVLVVLAIAVPVYFGYYIIKTIIICIVLSIRTFWLGLRIIAIKIYIKLKRKKESK